MDDEGVGDAGTQNEPAADIAFRWIGVANDGLLSGQYVTAEEACAQAERCLRLAVVEGDDQGSDRVNAVRSALDQTRTRIAAVRGWYL